MAKSKLVLLISVIVILIIVAIGVVILVTYSKSDNTKDSLLTRYFHAFSANDNTAIVELTRKDVFTNDLGITKLDNGSYELFLFDEKSEGCKRFIITATNEAGIKEAYIADMFYSPNGFSYKIDSIKLIDKATYLKN